MSNDVLKPFLKWAGGKRWLLESSQFMLPPIKGRYIEPFLGGGAIFFGTRPRNAILSDSNQRLMELYIAIRDDVHTFVRLMSEHSRRHSRDYYYKMREKRCRKLTTRAAQFLYLNRTCWNGLYRENLRGKFNVPIGTKETVLFETDDFFGWSQALKAATLLCCDFELAIDKAVERDFIFVDPPYTVRHNMNGFIKYNQNIFAWHDQIRLRDALQRAAKRGVSFAMTNADHESIRELYKNFGNMRQLLRHSKIAAQSSSRAPATELLVFG